MAGSELTLELFAPGEIEAEARSDVTRWKLKIAASWKAAAEGILRVSKDLHEARAALNAQDRQHWTELSRQLHDQRIISAAIQKKLLVIGGKYQNFRDVAACLPPRYNAIYQLTDLNRAQLQSLAKSGRLTPMLDDRQIGRLLEDEEPGGAPEREDLPSIALFRLVRTSPELDDSGKAELTRIAARLRKLTGLKLYLTAEGARVLGEDRVSIET